ncbi:MAG: CotH kinase family protein, partial [Candidatus Symbiothrix sp.]|nr:CotH kinase family protein [Candidatus Symbiothrix sp.]
MRKTYNSYWLLMIGLLVCRALDAQNQLTNIPALYITTETGTNPTSKEVYQAGHIMIKSSDPTEVLDMDVEIRGRGNSTWGLAKKPYRIKLANKQHLLNMPAEAKIWVLLANYGDKTLIRNALAFEIGKLLEFEYTPAYRFVDLYLNGAYQGNYMLTDQVEVKKNRVPVQEQALGTTALPDLSGGYLLEVDGFGGSEPVHFNTSHNMTVTVKYPKDDEITSEQLTYIKKFTQTFEDALFSSNFKNPTSGYRAYVDEHSLINWYIACELTGNPDAFWSIYMYKYRNSDKLYFGPLWDFDIAFNNDDRLGDAVQKLMRNSAHDPKAWIKRMWEDPWFKQAVNTRWLQLLADKKISETLLGAIDAIVSEINASQKENFKKWNNLNTKIFREPFLFPTYQGGINFLKQYIQTRVSFLTTSFASDLPEEVSVPFVAEPYYYSITNKNSTNRITVSDPSTELDQPLVMWSAAPDDYSQEWKFVSLGDGVYQIINRNSELAIAGNGYSNNLIQVTPSATDKKQQWRVVPVSTGNLYGLINESSHYSINNSGGNKSNGTPAIEYTERITESANQQWYIQKVNIIVIEIPTPID